MTKIFKIADTEIHDHYIIFSILALVITVTFINAHYLDSHNCLILEPDIDCTSYGTIARPTINASAYQFVTHSFSIYGLDEYRSINGTQHIECQPNNNTCSFHYDVYSPVFVGPDGIFNLIGHFAETLDRICWPQLFIQGITPQIYGCTGFPDYWSVLGIWILIIIIPYYGVKHTYFYWKYGSIISKRKG